MIVACEAKGCVRGIVHGKEWSDFPIRRIADASEVDPRTLERWLLGHSKPRAETLSKIIDGALRLGGGA
jgi:hypothetical protein